MTEKAGFRPVVIPSQKESKSNGAKMTLGLAGAATGTAHATFLNSTRFGTDINRAVDSYNKNKNIIKNTFTKKEYINKFIKDARIKRAGAGMAIAVAATAAGLAFGTVIDSTFDIFRNRTKNKRPVYLKESD